MLVNSQLHVSRIPIDFAVKYPLTFLVVLPQFLSETPVSAHWGFTLSLSSGSRSELAGRFPWLQLLCFGWTEDPFKTSESEPYSIPGVFLSEFRPG